MSGEAEHSARAIRRPRWLGFALRALVSVALVVVLVSRAGLGSIVRAVVGAHLGWLALGFALGLVAAGLQANQLRGLLRAMGLPRGYLSTLRLDTAGRAFDAALPTSIGGDVARAGMASSDSKQRLGAVLSVFLRRLLQVPGLVVVLAVGLVASWDLPYIQRVRPFALGVCIAGAGLIVLIALTTRVKAVHRLPMPAKLRRLVAEWDLARKEALRLTGATTHRGPRRPFLPAAGQGLLFWAVVVLSQACFMFAVVAGWDLPYIQRVLPLALGVCIAGGGIIVLIALTTRVKAVRRLPMPAKLRRLVAERDLARKEAPGRTGATTPGGSRRPFLLAAGRGLLFWVVVVLSQVCFMYAVDAVVPLGYAAVVVTTVNALSMLPISLGGYGLREATFSAFLTATGTVTTAQGAAVGACLSIQTLALGVAGGVTLLTMPRRSSAPVPKQTRTRAAALGGRQ